MLKRPKDAFGWNEHDRFVFTDGVVDDSMVFYAWDKNTKQRKYLQNVASTLDKNK